MAGRFNKAVQYQRESAHKSRAAGGNASLDDCMQRELARLSSLLPREPGQSRGQPGLRPRDKARSARTGRRTVDEAEAVEAAEDSPTLAEAGLAGEGGVVTVEAEVEGVAAEAEDEHQPPQL